MNPILREIPERDRIAWAMRVETWGYPRKIEDKEIREGVWIRDARGDGVIWFTILDLKRGWWCVHGIGSPEGRKRRQLMNRWLVTAIQVLGGILGAERVYSALPTIDIGTDYTKDFPVASMRRYLKRMGWDGEDEIGPYIDLEVKEGE